jgi:predicted ATPase/transcriptional regulator with XRE-family HTH domain
VNDERAALSAFGALLRRHRLAAGLSQDALAELSGMSSVGISALERGDRRSPYRDTITLLSRALRLGPDAAAEFEAVATRPRSRKPRCALPRPAGSLPSPRTNLVGREREVSDVVDLLAGNRHVTLTGVGGIGKTRVALAVGAALDQGTRPLVCLAELAPVAHESSVAVVTAVGRALSMQESPNRPQLETLLAHLKQLSLVLILDNCEHVIEEAAALADALLRGCANLRILATSREPLRINGERIYRLSSLGVPASDESHQLDAAGAAAFAAVELFVARAQAIDRGFALDDDNAPIVADICRQLDGIPLAIELAAARVNVLPVRALSTMLDQRFGILTSGDRTALARHQTMRALLDWSYDLLTPPEQLLFERLAVFSGGCTLAAATAVFREVAIDETRTNEGAQTANEGGAELDILSLLSSLIDKSLAVVDLKAAEPRYGLLESFGRYARDKLAARGAAEAAAHRHAQVYLRFAEHLEREYETECDAVWYGRAETELANWRAVLEWALVRRGDVVLGQRLVGLLIHVWHEFAPAEGRRWIRLALELVNEQTPRQVCAKLELTESHLATSFREHTQALAAAERARTRYEQLADLDGVARAQQLAGLPLLMLDRPAEAETMLRGALASARVCGAGPKLVATILRDIAIKLRREGDYAGSRNYYSEALEVFRKVGSDRGAASTLSGLSWLEYRLGNTHAALGYSSEALAILRACRARVAVDVLFEVGYFLIKLARFDEAEVALRECLATTREQQRDAMVVFTAELFATIGAFRPQADPGLRLETQMRSARILGFVDAFFVRSANAPRTPIHQHDYELLAGTLRDALGDQTLAKLSAEGAAMTEDQVVAYVGIRAEPP